MTVGGGGAMFKNNDMNQCIAIRLKFVYSSVDIGNQRYINVQNFILLKYKSDKQIARLRRGNFFAPSPNPKNVPTALLIRDQLSCFH